MKRVFDFLSSLIVIIIIFPLILLIGGLVKITSKGDILFKQRRIGKDNIEFYIYKFRTMRIDTPNIATDLLENPEKWITGIGKFLRKTSLDELPQLFNILKGDMSVVGPRPALYNQFDLIKARKKEGIDKLVPGLTGWAQINGRDEISLELKVKRDKEYLERQNFMFDMKIIFLSVLSVLKRDGVKEGTTEQELIEVEK